MPFVPATRANTWIVTVSPGPAIVTCLGSVTTVLDDPEVARMSTRNAAADHKRVGRRTGVPVGVDDRVIVAVDRSVVVKVAVEIAPDQAVLIEVLVDGGVVVAIEGSVQNGVAAPGVHDKLIAGSDRLPAEGSAGVPGVIGADGHELREHVGADSAGLVGGDAGTGPVPDAG